MQLANSKTHYKPYFSSLPKKNKENNEYISPLGFLEVHQAENIVEADGDALNKLKLKVGRACEKLNEKFS